MSDAINIPTTSSHEAEIIQPRLTPFSFEGRPIRVFDRDGDPWFVAADVCDALQLSNPTVSVKALDEDERAKLNLGRQGAGTVISESGLYTLVLRCRGAVTPGEMPYRFRKWVTAEVLPSIRKTGRYSQPVPVAVSVPDLSDTDAMLRLLAEQVQGRIADRHRAAQAEAQLAISAPKVDFYDRYAEADGAYNLRNAGRVLCQMPQKWIDSLKGRYLHYEGGTLVPYAHHRQKGLFSVKAHIDGDGKTRPQTYVTPKGIQHFAKSLGVTPEFDAGAPAPEFNFGGGR